MIDIEKLCSKYRIKIQKDLGQNFLQNDQVLRKIINVATLSKNDHVLEIGPGLGVLTTYLLEEAGKVLAVELDSKLVHVLHNEFADKENFTVLHKNILDIPNAELLKTLGGGHYKVVANIPYNITSPILRKFTEQVPSPEMCVFLVQKEVAERVCALPGSLSILGVATQFFMDTEYIMTVPAEDFIPAPKVDSAVIRLSHTNKYSQLAQDKGLFIQDIMRIVRIGFSAKRKQLHNNLTAGLKVPTSVVKAYLAQVGLSEQVRAQELSVEQWIDLTFVLHTL